MTETPLVGEPTSTSPLDTMRDGVCWLDLEFNIIKVNSTMELWYPQSQPLVGKKCYEAYQGRTTPCEVCPTQHTLTTGEIGYELITESGPSGEVRRWIDLVVFPLIDPVTKELKGVVEYVRDVTEHKKTEEALRASETRYRNLVEHIPAVVYLADPEHFGTALYLAPQVENFLGYSPLDFETIPNLWEKLVYSEDGARVRAEVERCKSTGEPFVLEYRMVSKDGQVKWFHDEAWLVYDADGQPLFLQGMFQDITERKKMEESLIQEKEKYRVLAEGAPLGISIIGSDGHYQYLNPEFTKMFGYTLDDLPTGREWFGKAYPDAEYRRQVVLDWKLHLQGAQAGIASQRIYSITCKDGSEKKINFRAVPLEQGDHFILYEDITKRLEAEEALKQSEVKHRSLVEQLPAITYTAALDESYPTTYISPQVETLLGLSPSDYVADPELWVKLLHPDDRERVLGKVAESQASGVPLDVEYRMVTKHGEIIWFRDLARVVGDLSGIPLYLQGVMLDITPRKNLEGSLKRRESVLEAVVYAAENFLGGSAWENSIQEILKRLGQSFDASRAYIFENFRNQEGILLAHRRSEWVAPEITTQIPSSPPQVFNFDAAGLGRWQEILSAGRMICGSVDEFPFSEQVILTSQGIKSVTVVPIFVGQQWWGGIWFDNCCLDQKCSNLEMEALRTAARLLGSAILHEKEEKALKKSEEQLGSLSHQLMEAQEVERQRLATELHDVLGHDLLLMKLHLESCQNLIQPEQSSLQKEIKQVLDHIGRSVGNISRIVQDLYPTELETLGLTTALHSLIKDFCSVQQLLYMTEIDNIDDLFDMAIQKKIYRLVQEALTNVGKHAMAKFVYLRAEKKPTKVIITIKDDGEGFDVNETLSFRKTMGLLGMQEQAKTLDGTLQIFSRENKGTSIVLTIPIP